jgi:hypothetical protein
MQHPAGGKPVGGMLFSEQLPPARCDERFSQPLVSV